jgi:hypothetical protein
MNATQSFTTSDLKTALRNGPHAWPGGYPTYFVTSDGGALSHASVKRNLRSVIDSMKTGTDDGWRVVACQANWEDPELYCDDSNERIESAYAEDAR